jgi:hypothetical protein
MPFDVDWNYFQESPLTGRPPEFVMEMFYGLPLENRGGRGPVQARLPSGGTTGDRLVDGLLRPNHVHRVDWAEEPSELDRLISSADSE